MVRLKSSTLIENLVALCIISLCFSLSFLVINNLANELSGENTKRWLRLVNSISSEESSNVNVSSLNSKNYDTHSNLVTFSAEDLNNKNEILPIRKLRQNE